MSSVHILYLDDEEPLVFIVKRTLRKLGHSVSGFTDAAAALARFSASPDHFDLVLSDLSMPGMDGIEFAAAVRAVQSDAYIVLVSGYVNPNDVARAKAAGAHDVILKPNTAQEMGRAVEALLEGRSSNNT